MADMSHMFYSTDAPRTSADGLTLSRSAERPRTNSGLFLRMFVDNISLSFLDDRSSVTHPNQIQLRGSSLVFSSSLCRASPPVFSLNLAEISVIERLWDGFSFNDHSLLSFKTDCPSEKSLIVPKYSFDQPRSSDSHSLTGPQMEICVAMKSIADGGIDISITFQHAVCNLTLALVNRWATALGEFLAPQTSPSSSIAFSCTVKLKSVEVTLTESSSGEESENCLLFRSLPFVDILNSRWTKLPESPFLAPHPSGGFRVVFYGVSFTACSNSSPLGSLSVTVEEINGFLQLYLEGKDAWELGFISLRSVKEGSKISVSKEMYVGPEGTASKSEIEETERLLVGDTFDMPILAIPEVLVISAGNVYAGIPNDSIACLTLLRS